MAERHVVIVFQRLGSRPQIIEIGVEIRFSLRFKLGFGLLLAGVMGERIFPGRPGKEEILVADVRRLGSFVLFLGAPLRRIHQPGPRLFLGRFRRL